MAMTQVIKQTQKKHPPPTDFLVVAVAWSRSTLNSKATVEGDQPELYTSTAQLQHGVVRLGMVMGHISALYFTTIRQMKAETSLRLYFRSLAAPVWRIAANFRRWYGH